MKSLQVEINIEADLPFRNHADHCIGTGRMGLALRQEYLTQLKLVQQEIGFSYIRGHGLFCDDMAIYQTYQAEDGQERVEYNFTYLDRVMDSYQELGIKPFLELGFMPEKMASGDQTVFYWKGNVTPPKDYERWTALVQAVLYHLMERYGTEEVITWPIEVWNEPNLSIFWKDADMEEYFQLFAVTFSAVKSMDRRFRVGGPAICGVQDELWIRSFLKFCEKEEIALDFVTRHHYTIDVTSSEGHYSYVDLRNPEDSLVELERTREIVDSFERFRGLELHITEFNTSYRPDSPVHDTNQNAAYLAYLLSRMGECHASYSYWTFGDEFEEQGVPFTPFHGGFGLVADGGIPKPTFWTFRFFKELKGRCIHKSEEALIIKREDDTYCGIVWNLNRGEDRESINLDFSFPWQNEREYFVLTKTVDEAVCNPLKLWHDMGEPYSLTKTQLSILQEASRPLVASDRKSAVCNTAEVNLKIGQNSVVFFELSAIQSKSDRGYDYDKVMKAKVKK